MYTRSACTLLHDLFRLFKYCLSGVMSSSILQNCKNLYALKFSTEGLGECKLCMVGFFRDVYFFTGVRANVCRAMDFQFGPVLPLIFFAKVGYRQGLSKITQSTPFRRFKK